jgi:hypothetical protein
VVNKGGDIIVGKEKMDATMRLIQQRFPYPTKYEIVNVSNYSSINFINDNYKGINNNIDKQNYKNQINNENKDFKKIYIQYILILVIIVIMAFLYYFGKNEKLKYTKISNSE